MVILELSDEDQATLLEVLIRFWSLNLGKRDWTREMILRIDPAATDIVGSVSSNERSSA